MNKKTLAKTSAILALMVGPASAMAQCPAITQAQLTSALQAAVAQSNGGLGFNMWATVVGHDGTVCLVTKTGAGLNDQWLISRVISAQKANTALGLSTNDFALSTANLYSPVQPNGTLYGLQAANPVDTSVAYSGISSMYGTSLDPMRGRKIGGTNVFGGGLALYDNNKRLVGGLGVSGDTSCADHNIAWRTRENLFGFTAVNVPAGVGSNTFPAGAGNTYKDNIIYLAAPSATPPFAPTESPNGFKHPFCSQASKDVAETFNN